VLWWYLIPCEIRALIYFAGLDSVCNSSEQWFGQQEKMIWVAKVEGKKQKCVLFSVQSLRQKEEEE